jgi:uncharacterized membrane protein YgdD (TMEM256/DUF423 family)
MSIARFAGRAGAIAGSLTVALGAFGAHALKGGIDAHALELWRTATLYQGLHALALLALASQAPAAAATSLRVAAYGFLAGLVLFCGSLYALALGAPPWLGAITPLGGLAWIVAWIALARYFWRAG